jgi:hypothetical protein
MAAKNESSVVVRTMKATAPKGFKRTSSELLAEKAGISREDALASVTKAINRLSAADLRLIRGIQIIALM